MSDDLETLLRDHDGLEGLAIELGQQDGPPEARHYLPLPAHPIVLWILAVIASVLIAYWIIG